MKKFIIDPKPEPLKGMTPLGKTVFHLCMSILVFMCFMAGCKDATRAEFSSLGKQHQVDLYSGGIKVRSWVATGNVSNQSNSDGYCFMDRETGKLVEVSGTVVITQIN